MVKHVDISPEQISESLCSLIDKKIFLSVLQKFIDNGLTYKIRTTWKPKDDNSSESYRVFCYIKKNKEALIINTKSYDENLLLLQIRILDKSTFDKLDDYSENIRNQILNAKYNCNSCGCSEKAYVINYRGITYRKCHMICANFRFSNFKNEDIDSIINIVNREILLGKPNRRNEHDL